MVGWLQQLLGLQTQPATTQALGDQRGYWCWTVRPLSSDGVLGWHATSLDNAIRIMENGGQLLPGPRQDASNNEDPVIFSAKTFDGVRGYMGPSVRPEKPNTQICVLLRVALTETAGRDFWAAARRLGRSSRRGSRTGSPAAAAKDTSLGLSDCRFQGRKDGTT